MAISLNVVIKQAGKVLHEGKVDASQGLQVGNLGATGELPPNWNLFVEEGGKVFLQLPANAAGELVDKGRPANIDELKKHPKHMPQVGDFYRFELNENRLGNFTAGDIEISFTPIVAGAVQQAKKVVTAAASGALSSVDMLSIIMRNRSFDLIFRYVLVGSLAIHSVTGGLMWIWDIPDDLLTIDDVPDRFAKLIVDIKKIEEKRDKPKPTQAAKVAEEEETAAPEQKAEAAKADEGADAAGPVKSRNEQLREKVASKGILGILGRTGGSGALGNILSGDGLSGDIDSALEGVGGVRTASTGGEVRGTRGGGNAKSVGIGDLKAGGGRSVGLEAKSTRRVRSTAGTGTNVGGTGKLDAKVISGVVKKNLRRIQFCYEKELKNNKSLAGNVVVRFTIGASGAIDSVSVRSSTLGSSAVESCMTRTIRRWEFPAPSNGTVTVEYPFIFTAGG